VYGIAPFVNLEEQPVQLSVWFTVFFEKTSVFAEPKNIELRHSYPHLRCVAENSDSYIKELLQWRKDSGTASDHCIWTPRSSLHPIITWIAHTLCGWAVCAIAGYIIYTLYDTLQGSGDKQTPTSPKGPSPNSWSNSWSSVM
jgi:hypothetical protein